MFKKLNVLVLSLLFLTVTVSMARADGFLFKSQRDALAAKGLNFDFEAIEDYISLFRGGISHKDSWLSRFDARVDYDLEKANLFKGGLLHIDFSNTGGGPKLTGDLLGDLQGCDNNEGLRLTHLIEGWYQQSLFGNKLSIKFGVNSITPDFLTSSNAQVFINYAFGLMSSLSQTTNVSTFPQPVPGARVKYEPNTIFDFLAGFYQGSPNGPSQNERGTHFGTQKGLFSIEEAQCHYKIPFHSLAWNHEGWFLVEQFPCAGCNRI